jgi:hypothetical protein
MAHTAWVAMTRVARAGGCWSSMEACVDAGMRGLNEMANGRTDDPENPISVPPFADPIWASGQRAASTGRTHARTRHVRQNSHRSSCIREAVHTCTLSARRQSRWWHPQPVNHTSLPITPDQQLTRNNPSPQHAAIRSRHTSDSVPGGTHGRRCGYRSRKEPALPEQPDAVRHRTPSGAGRSTQ